MNTYNNNPTLALTPSEQSVVQRLRLRRIATKRSLCQQLSLSHMTVVRALQKAGYHNSFNANAAYYTLPQTPTFDAHGLWFYKRIGFSRHGNLLQTLVALIEQSPAGHTVEELQSRLDTRVANVLCRLAQAGPLHAERLGRHTLYCAAKPAVHARQKARRLADLAATPTTCPPPPPSRPALPGGVSALEVISLLQCLIQTPRAQVRILCTHLHRQGISLTPAQVRAVIAFYELKKKRHIKRGNAGWGIGPTGR